MPYYYAISIFLSAFLLFQIQPVIGKILLPWFGGTPTVWSTVLLFSQVLLTGGYAYAYWLLGRLRNRRQAVVHLVLLSVSLGLLLITALFWSAPLIPDESWKPQNSNLPIWEILRILAVSIGFPFLLLASNSTLTQAWFHRDNPKPTPYRLYALSNIGFLLALISYPILIEPNLTLRTQTTLWSFGYIIFASIAAFLTLRTYRASQVGAQGSGRLSGTEKRPANHIYVMWVALAATATTLLMAVTNQITQEVAVIPFLWVLPLTIYLLTFILAFSGGYLYSRWLYLITFIILTVASSMLLNLPTSDITLQIFIYMLVLFVGCMICHNELYALRPDARFLPSFYLMVALGGALGGIFVTLIAPTIFSTGFWELQWGLIACVIFLAIIIQLEPASARRKRPRKSSARGKQQRLVVKPLVIVIAILILLQSIYTIYYMREISSETLWADRNFYGVLRVWEMNQEVPKLLANQLTHGQTTHGFQFQPDEIRNLPTTYYTESSGVGLSLLNHPNRPDNLRIGALGLGIGVIGSYGKPGDVFRFYEVNPDVIEIAEGKGDYFSFLTDSEAAVELIPGDARVSLERELETTGSQNYDLLVLDTFSGDAIPLHLLTKEAFDIYLAHLKQDGVIAVNVSNRYFNLDQAVFKLADEFDLDTALIRAKGDGLQGFDSIWVLLSREVNFQDIPAIAEASAPRPTIPANFRLWTDDFSNLFQIIK